MTGILGIHHVGIVVESLEASTAWYVEPLGFERLSSFGWPGVQAAFIGRGALRLEPFQNNDAAPMAEGRRRAETNLEMGGINHFALEVADLDATVAALEAKGVAIVSPRRSGRRRQPLRVHPRQRADARRAVPARVRRWRSAGSPSPCGGP